MPVLFVNYEYFFWIRCFSDLNFLFSSSESITVIQDLFPGKILKQILFVFLRKNCLSIVEARISVFRAISVTAFKTTSYL